MIIITDRGSVQYLQCQHDSHTMCVALAEMIIINGRGIVQYNFEATVDEELTVDRGEQVMLVHDACMQHYMHAGWLASPCIFKLKPCAYNCI